jgi:hypothetical protein
MSIFSCWKSRNIIRYQQKVYTPKTLLQLMKSEIMMENTLQLQILKNNQRYPIFFVGGPYEYLLKNYQRTAKFFLTWGLNQRYFPDH